MACCIFIQIFSISNGEMMSQGVLSHLDFGLVFPGDILQANVKSIVVKPSRDLAARLGLGVRKSQPGVDLV